MTLAARLLEHALVVDINERYVRHARRRHHCNSRLPTFGSTSSLLGRGVCREFPCRQPKKTCRLRIPPTLPLMPPAFRSA
jgi:hypothetical protein